MNIKATVAVATFCIMLALAVFAVTYMVPRVIEGYRDDLQKSRTACALKGGVITDDLNKTCVKKEAVIL